MNSCPKSGFTCKILISILPALFISNAATAQELWDLSLEELVNVKVVSATRKEAVALRLPFVVTILSGEELSRWGAENLADGLQTAAGLQVAKAPADFPQYSVTIRGNSADFLNIRTLFLVDGIPVRNPNAGFDPSWIPLSIIKRVEIVKGPASNLYGANAFGGVVNIITKSGADLGSSEKWELEGGLGLRTAKDVVRNENVGGASGFLNAGKNETLWKSFFSGQYFSGDNTEQSYPGHKYRDLFGKIQNKLSDTVTLTNLALLSSDQSQVGVANANSPMNNDFAHVQSSVDVKLDENSSFNITGSYSGFKHYLQYTDSLDRYDNQGQVIGVHSQYSLNLTPEHALLLGAEFSQEDGSLKTKENSYATFPPTLQSVGWDTQTQSTYGIYSQYEYTGWQKFLPSLGIRMDSNSKFGNAFSPRFGISYIVDSNTTLYSSVGSGFRAPVFNENYIRGFGKVGNPNLKPEFTTTYEAGIKSVLLDAQNSLSIFNEKITQKVDAELLPGSTLYTYNNAGTASIVGLELDGSYKIVPSFRLYYNTTQLRTEKGSGGSIEQVAEENYVLGASWTWNQWTSDAAILRKGELFYYNSNPAIPSDPQGRVFLPATTTAKLQLKYQISEATSATFIVNNLTDQTYKEKFSPFLIQNGLYLPGRTFALKFSSKF
jgi:outer membrane receptor for ferrienterochelin and colicins